MKLMNAILLTSCLSMVACTGFEQDPYKSKDEAIRNAKSVVAKPEKIRATSSDIISIDVPSLIKVKEGVTATIDFKLKSFLTGYNYTFEIQNMDLFPGAKIDAQSKKLIWTPAVNTANTSSSSRDLEMTVLITAIPTSASVGKVQLQATQKIPFLIETVQTTPSIVEIRQVQNSLDLNEGSVQYFTVFVEDNGSDAASTVRPTLVFSGLLAPYTAISNIQYQAAIRQWKFDVQSSLRNFKLGTTLMEAPLTVVAVNRFRNASAPNVIPYRILSQFGLLASNFASGQELTAGVLNKISFVIYDTKSTSAVRMTEKLNLPVGADITCDTTSQTFQQCQLTWTPAATDVGPSFSVDIKAELKSLNIADTRSEIRTVNLAFKVKAK